MTDWHDHLSWLPWENPADRHAIQSAICEKLNNEPLHNFFAGNFAVHCMLQRRYADFEIGALRHSMAAIPRIESETADTRFAKAIAELMRDDNALKIIQKGRSTHLRGMEHSLEMLQSLQPG